MVKGRVEMSMKKEQGDLPALLEDKYWKYTHVRLCDLIQRGVSMPSLPQGYVEKWIELRKKHGRCFARVNVDMDRWTLERVNSILH